MKPSFLIVLGVGAFIEISEYIVMKTIPGNGVGGYDNNMQDLIANLSGSAVYIIISKKIAQKFLNSFA